MSLDDTLITKTEDFLKDAFTRSDAMQRDAAAAAYRIEHSYRVANIGRAIAQKEGFDETAMVIGCLLHDVAYCRELITKEEQRGHGRLSAQMVRPFLEDLKLSREVVEDICYGIAIHVDDVADFEGKRTAFAETISDADNIDRFDAYRLYEGLLYANFHEMTLVQKRERVEQMLKQLQGLTDYHMATATAEQLWQDRLYFAISFYQKLESQLKSSDSVS